MRVTVYWSLACLDQAPLESLDYLSSSETEKLTTLRFPKRRNEWLLGRWAAKSLAQKIPAFQRYTLEQIEVRNTPQGAPFLHTPAGDLVVGSLSISHREGLAFCALADPPVLCLGADLEKIEPRNDAFVQDYFTDGECSLVASCPAENKAMVVTLIWSVKEAMLKALGVGLRQDTRSVEVRSLTRALETVNKCNEWREVQVFERGGDQKRWQAWWRYEGMFVLSLAARMGTETDFPFIQFLETSR